MASSGSQKKQTGSFFRVSQRWNSCSQIDMIMTMMTMMIMMTMMTMMIMMTMMTMMIMMTMMMMMTTTRTTRRMMMMMMMMMMMVMVTMQLYKHLHKFLPMIPKLFCSQNADLHWELLRNHICRQYLAGDDAEICSYETMTFFNGFAMTLCSDDSGDLKQTWYPGEFDYISTIEIVEMSLHFRMYLQFPSASTLGLWRLLTCDSWKDMPIKLEKWNPNDHRLANPIYPTLPNVL